MEQRLHRVEVATRGAGLYDISDTVIGWIAAQGLATGLLTIWCRHTSASLIVQENASPAVRADLEAFLRDLVPQDGRRRYRHAEEGPDDMPAHIRSVLTSAHLSVPVTEGRPMLGTWQAIYLYEHRAAPHRRELVLHLLGERTA